MTAPRILPAVIVLAALMAGCGTTGGLKGQGASAQKGGRCNGPLPAANSGRGGYYKDDGPGCNIPPGLENVPDAVVKAEPYAKWANRPYTVFGQTYVPVVNEEPFTQRGVASWYGVKYHGQRTSSGEPYDMYKMTAAHPTLPIPSYVRITSVASGKSVVVRINDRGPFHASRIIDVSYTAALKLGLLGRGSHEVNVERLFANGPARMANARPDAIAQAAQATEAAPVITAPVPQPPRAETVALAPAPPEPAVQGADAGSGVPGGFYLQLGAYSRAESAQDQAQQMSRQLADAGVAIGKLEVAPAGSVHRLYGGPFESRAEAQNAARALPPALGLKPIVVKR